MNSSYLYLLVNLGSILVPVILSFDKKVAFFKKWKAFWPANLITLAFFVTWDAFFEHAGVWGFNDSYLLGPRIIGLPIEEWLFFICVPYACVFLYETFRCWIPGYPFKNWGRPAMVLVFLLSLFLVFRYPDRHYTFFTALFTMIGSAVLWRFNPKWMGWFVFAYLIILIPFIISNGVLTGIEFWKYPILNNAPDMVKDQIVWYNNEHNLQFRILSVPIDDTLYGFLLIGMNVAIYERLMKRYQLR